MPAKRKTQRPPTAPEDDSSDSSDTDSNGSGVLFSAMLDHLSDPCLIVEPDGRMRYANEAARGLLHMKGRATGRRLSEVVAENQVLDLFAAAVTAARPRAAMLALAFTSQGPRHYVVSAAPVPLETGLFYRLALSPVKEPLRLPGPEKNEAMLHQLGDPLSIMLGYLENLLDGVIQQPAEVRKCHLTMHRQALQMKKVLTD
jgi:PAS fold